MNQHPIPRQITTFEFKLIGFLTLKQFIYIVIFIPLGFIFFKIFPIPLLNILGGVAIVILGFALALVPVNDRPLDVWIRNFIKRLTSPTQFVYHKKSEPIYFLEDLFFTKSPHITASHVESKEKLNAYLASRRVATPQNTKRQNINALIANPMSVPKPKTVTFIPTATPLITNNIQTVQIVTDTPSKNPFLIGTIRNNKKLPIPSILIYVKDQKGTALRLLKTNSHGVFATFKAIPPGDYVFEIKDPGNRYFFDTMKIKVENINPKPFEFVSKEII